MLTYIPFALARSQSHPSLTRLHAFTLTHLRLTLSHTHSYTLTLTRTQSYSLARARIPLAPNHTQSHPTQAHVIGAPNPPQGLAWSLVKPGVFFTTFQLLSQRNAFERTKIGCETRILTLVLTTGLAPARTLALTLTAALAPTLTLTLI